MGLEKDRRERGEGMRERWWEEGREGGRREGERKGGREGEGKEGEREGERKGGKEGGREGVEGREVSINGRERQTTFGMLTRAFPLLFFLLSLLS